MRSDLEAASMLFSHLPGSALLLCSWNSTLYCSSCSPVSSVFPVTDRRLYVGCMCGDWPRLILEGLYMKWVLGVPWVRCVLRFVQSVGHPCLQRMLWMCGLCTKIKNEHCITTGAQHLRCWGLYVDCV